MLYFHNHRLLNSFSHAFYKTAVKKIRHDLLRNSSLPTLSWSGGADGADGADGAIRLQVSGSFPSLLHLSVQTYAMRTLRLDLVESYVLFLLSLSN